MMDSKNWNYIYQNLPHFAKISFWIIASIAIGIIIPLGYHHHSVACDNNKQDDFFWMKCYSKPDTIKIINNVKNDTVYLTTNKSIAANINKPKHKIKPYKNDSKPDSIKIIQPLNSISNAKNAAIGNNNNVGDINIGDLPRKEVTETDRNALASALPDKNAKIGIVLLMQGDMEENDYAQIVCNYLKQNGYSNVTCNCGPVLTNQSFRGLQFQFIGLSTNVWVGFK